MHALIIMISVNMNKNENIANNENFDHVNETRIIHYTDVRA